MSKIRRRVQIEGIVQGVGFRPFIFNLAKELGLAGWVTNDSVGVLLEVEGLEEAVSAFLTGIPERVPKLARIDSLNSKSIETVGEDDFVIRPSKRFARGQTLISPDLAICDECYREMMDLNNHRYLYPFINCTNCGPRFTIIHEMPYDRPYTTMSEFLLCPQCQAEYENPQNRRFYAQPNACPVCGPQVWLTDGKSRDVLEGKVQKPLHTQQSQVQIDCSDWVKSILFLRQELVHGKIASVKGLGGYHLVCDACNEDAVATLRERKSRPDQPLAVMMPNLDVVHRYCQLSEEEAKLLQSPSRPIVLLEWKMKGCDGIAQGVAGNLSRLGVMLPYTPLHHLLFDDQLSVLVMTSGNISGEPIIYNDHEVVERLDHVVDYFLMHNRKILRPCDDSVQRMDDRPVMIRRSRGFAPLPLRIKMPVEVFQSKILAAGGELKNTFALSRGEDIFLSQHIGDLKTCKSNHYYRQMIDELRELLGVTPEVVAHDLHPNYLSTKYVLERFTDARLIGVQHHHAHIASCMAEYGIVNPVIGFAFDGTGFGLDQKIWGGEVLIATPSDFQRWAYLRYLPMPGGDQAIREPWRVGAAYLNLAGVQWSEKLAFWNSIDLMKWSLLRQMMKQGVQTPETSSMGRLFDAVAAILGVRNVVSYEGQAAIELEEMAQGRLGDAYSFTLEGDRPTYQINPLPMIAEIADSLLQGVNNEVVAQRFHGTVVEMATQVAVQIHQELGIDQVVCSGGVFQNRLLSLGLKERLEGLGFQVYQQSQVPANDGGLALGQMYVAMYHLLQG